MFGWFSKKKALSRKLTTTYTPAPNYFKPRYVPLEQGTELIVAWPLNYGVAWRIEDDKMDTIGCNSRFFSQDDAELFVAALNMKQPDNVKFHYQVVKLHDDK